MKKYTQWYDVTMQEQENGVLTASVIHYGEYKYLHEAYVFLLQWIKKNGYEIKNKSPLGKRESIKEIYLVDSHNAKHKEEFQTKLVVEVEKINKYKEGGFSK